MSNETDPTLENIDFELEVSGLSTARPVIPKRDYEMTLVAVEVKQNSKETGNNLNLVFATTERLTSIQGEEVPSGFKITKYLPLQPNAEKVGNDTYDAEGFKKDIAAAYDGLSGCTDKNARPKLYAATFRTFIGTRVLVPVSVEKNDQRGGELANGIQVRGIKHINQA